MLGFLHRHFFAHPQTTFVLTPALCRSPFETVFAHPKCFCSLIVKHFGSPPVFLPTDLKICLLIPRFVLTEHRPLLLCLSFVFQFRKHFGQPFYAPIGPNMGAPAENICAHHRPDCYSSRITVFSESCDLAK